MCGIAGFWSWGSGTNDDWEASVTGMSDALRHRGPDSSGVWGDAAAGIALGHRRLAILDLSPKGHQPMRSASGRFVVVFNGEIYNFRELRAELEPSCQFNGGSDTEVLLAAVEAWGLEKAVQRFVGMFAFGLWDRAERALHLVRDRVGVKPLYYGWTDRSFLFGSELKAIRANRDFRERLDLQAIALLLRHKYIPAPQTIYRGVCKLPPGHILSLREPNRCDAVLNAYWSAEAVVARARRDPFHGSDADAVDELDRLLREAVSMRMVADVPLGAFLSGGVDSSLVVALMQAQSNRPVRTFTIGSPDTGYDEAVHAGRVAQHLGTQHTELHVSADDALSVIPQLPTMYDEPFADSSQIPTYLVSALARRHVTVSLSGDGGDELFAGYNRHVWGRRVGWYVGHVPQSVRTGASRAISGLTPAAWDALFERLAQVAPRRLGHRMPGYKLHKLAQALQTTSPAELYDRLTCHWHEPVVLGTVSTVTPSAADELVDFAAEFMYRDLIAYLPDDILTKLDRASMAVGLEARVPLLDHRVVEFAWRLPLSLKLRGGRSKWILRELLDRYVPAELIERPKSGFGVPLGAWLRSDLRDWAEGLLDPRRLLREGIFDVEIVRRRWAEHLSGRFEWQYHLWDVLMFQAWYESHATL